MYLEGSIDQYRTANEREGTHRMRSAWRVKLPNRCEEKIMVLFPRNVRSLSNKSGVRGARKE